MPSELHDDRLVKLLGNLTGRSGMSKRTVMKYVQMLERKGLIETEPTTVTNHEGKNWNGNLKYTILPISEIVDAKFQRELLKADTARRLQEHDRKHPRKEAT